jgi:WD40 repeat protein
MRRTRVEVSMPTDRPTLKIVKELSRKEIVFALAHVPGGRRLIFGGSDFGVYDVDLAQEKPEPRKLGAHDSYVTGLTIAGRKAVSGSYDGRLIWWDLESGELTRKVDAHAKWIRGVTSTSDGSLIASVADDMICRIWNAETGEKRHELKGHEAQTPHHFPSMLYACAFSPDGRYVATGDKVGHVVVWEVATGRQAATMEVPIMYTWDPKQRRHSIGGIRSLAFSPDGSRLAVGGTGQVGNIDHLDAPARVEVFDWRESKRTMEFPSDTFKGLVERLVFLPDGDRLLAVGGANDGFLMLLDLKTKAVLLQEKAKMHVHDATLGATPDLIFSCGHGRLVVLELNSHSD